MNEAIVNRYIEELRARNYDIDVLTGIIYRICDLIKEKKGIPIIEKLKHKEVY